jgi:hypothetical protein
VRTLGRSLLRWPSDPIPEGVAPCRRSCSTQPAGSNTSCWRSHLRIESRGNLHGEEGVAHCRRCCSTQPAERNTSCWSPPLRIESRGNLHGEEGVAHCRRCCSTQPAERNTSCWSPPLRIESRGNLLVRKVLHRAGEVAPCSLLEATHPAGDHTCMVLDRRLRCEQRCCTVQEKLQHAACSKQHVMLEITPEWFSIDTSVVNEGPRVLR